MLNVLNSFFAKISALFLVLMLILGVVLSIFALRALNQFLDETEQALNQDLAARMAEEFQPYVREKIDREMIEMEIRNIMGYNPRIEIYLLGGNGMIKAQFGSDQDIAQPVVNTRPLDAYIQGNVTLPTFGDDPLEVDRQKPFSAAPIEIMGEQGCYVYVILGGQRYETIMGALKNSYIARTSILGMVLLLLATGLLGIILFGILTRRIRVMRDTVQIFERGTLDARIEDGSKDELGQLARSFDQMSDTLVSNMDTLKRADQLRRELIANVSHDLRSPLASIQGYLETLTIKGKSLSEEKREQYIQTALRNTQTLNGLVGQLFELSKLDARQIEPEKEAFSIAELAQDIVLQFKPKADQAHISLEALTPDRLSLVYADIGLVERAISNLIDNAIRHTPSGGTVRIETSKNGDEIGVRVVDTGHGIPEADLPHIFERFYRVEKSRTKKKAGGAGLGLAIAKKIVELHGKTLSVQSHLGQGTTFQFSLPVVVSG